MEMFYVYGIVLNVISLGFYLYDLSNSTIEDKPLHQFLKFLFSVSLGWILVTSVLGGLDSISKLSSYNSGFWFSVVIFFGFLPVVFSGVNLYIYEIFNIEK
jgi:hypothetical protein